MKTLDRLAESEQVLLKKYLELSVTMDENYKTIFDTCVKDVRDQMKLEVIVCL